MLVPAMASTGTWFSSSTLRTPMWAAPRAPPPESTSPMRGRDGVAGDGASCAGNAVVSPKQTTASSTECLALMNIGSVVRIVCRRDNRPPNMRIALTLLALAPLTTNAAEDATKNDQPQDV